MCHFKSMKSFSFCVGICTQVYFDMAQRKQKHTDKQADMKLMGSLLSKCNTHIVFYNVNLILTVIFVITLYEKDT